MGYNIMVTRPTNHMISTRDHSQISSHDPDTWPTNFILITSHHQYQHLRHYFHIMTTSESLVSHMITTSSHHHGIRRPSSKDLVWASSRGLLEARKEDYFKINAGLGIRWWWLDHEKIHSIATTGAWSKENALNRFEKNHWESHEWSGKRRRLARRGLAWPFRMSTSASTMKHHTTRWVGVMVKYLPGEYLVTKPSGRRSSA